MLLGGPKNQDFLQTHLSAIPDKPGNNLNAKNATIQMIRMAAQNEKVTDANSFIEGLDTVFTENIIKKGKSVQSTGSDKKIKDQRV